MSEHSDTPQGVGGCNNRKAHALGECENRESYEVLLWTDREVEKPLTEAQTRYLNHLISEALGQHDPWRR